MKDSIRIVIMRIMLVLAMISAALYAFLESEKYIGLYQGDKWEHLQEAPEIVFAMYITALVTAGWIFVFVCLRKHYFISLIILIDIAFTGYLAYLVLDEAAYSYDHATPAIMAAGILDIICVILLLSDRNMDMDEKLKCFKPSVAAVIFSIIISIVFLIIAPGLIEKGMHEEFSQHMDSYEWVDENGESHEEESPGIIEYYMVSTHEAELLNSLKGAIRRILPVSVIYLLILVIVRRRLAGTVSKGLKETG